MAFNPNLLDHYVHVAIPGLTINENQSNPLLSTGSLDSITVDDNLNDMSSDQLNMQLFVNLTRVDELNDGNHFNSNEQLTKNIENDMSEQNECNTLNNYFDIDTNYKTETTKSAAQNEVLNLKRNELPYGQGPPTKKVRLTDGNDNQLNITQEATDVIDINQKCNNQSEIDVVTKLMADRFENLASEMTMKAIQMFEPFENGLKELIKTYLGNMLEELSNDQIRLMTMKIAMDEVNKQNDELKKLLEDKVNCLEKTVKMLNVSNALLQEQKSKHKCDACGKSIDTVLFCNASCSQIVL